MNNYYLRDYSSHLERVLSTGYKLQYSTKAIERAVAYSSFFQRVEKDYLDFAPMIDEESLIRSIFPEIQFDINVAPTYKQCLWAAESYMNIQGATRLTFEAIFLYIPIQKMYEYFDIYHEMDYSQIIDEFKRLYSLKSVLEIIVDKYNFSLKEISEQTGVSYDTLFSLKKRRKDIKKLNVQTASLLSSILRVRIETLTEISV